MSVAVMQGELQLSQERFRAFFCGRYVVFFYFLQQSSQLWHQLVHQCSARQLCAKYCRVLSRGAQQSNFTIHRVPLINTELGLSFKNDSKGEEA